MNRRQFVKLSASTLLLASSSVALSDEVYKIQKVEPLTIKQALMMLDSLESSSVSSEGAWNLFQVYTHLAQSVEFSMTGFPEHKSWLFKNTVGSVAFLAFSAKGSMSHGLDEVIPGAPELVREGDAKLALSRLRESLQAFERFEGVLQPHFAYGDLSKADYEQAHVMHLNNHLDAFSMQPA